MAFAFCIAIDVMTTSSDLLLRIVDIDMYYLLITYRLPISYLGPRWVFSFDLEVFVIVFIRICVVAIVVIR